MLGLLAHRKHWLLLLLYPLVGLGFAECEALVPTVVHVMEWQPVDSWIPFVPWMVAPYVFWYFTVALALLWTGSQDPAEFRRLMAFLYLGMTSAYVVYLLFPNGQNLRPPLAALGSGWDYDLLRWIYSHDTPTNCNPSIHVVDAMAVWIALARDRHVRALPAARVALAAVSLAIIASTVLVKQHSVVDVFGGLLWSALWYLILYSRWSPFFRFRPT